MSERALMVLRYLDRGFDPDAPLNIDMLHPRRNPIDDVRRLVAARMIIDQQLAQARLEKQIIENAIALKRDFYPDSAVAGQEEGS